MPVVRVSWYDAMAYAAWLGGALPTEAQWEFTARGKEGRPYPWGSEGPDCGRAHVFDCAVEGRHQPRPVSPARESGKTPEAVYDLAGNVSEWCRDWFALSYPTVQAEVIDPAGPRAGSERVMRGASFNDPADLLCASSRGRWDPDDGAQDNLGFRVVWASP
jgi:formylglycine-generating enzyme required for sulfatase activity